MEEFTPNQPFESIEELQAALGAHQQKVNHMPRAEFDYLCSLDIHQLLYSKFGPDSPIQIRTRIPKELLDEMPFLKLMHVFLTRIQEVGELKLTAKGNLPVKWVKELYGLGLVLQSDIERGITKLYNDADSIAITNVKILSTISGLAKKRNNKLSLTQKGRKLLEGTETDITAFFTEIFLTYFQQFNWGYHDLYEDSQAVQQFSGYLLYLTLQHGEEERAPIFYAEKLLQAFPMILEIIPPPSYNRSKVDYLSNCINTRLFKRFFDFWGFTLAPGEETDSFGKEKSVQTRPILKQVIYLEKGKLQGSVGERGN